MLQQPDQPPFGVGAGAGWFERSLFVGLDHGRMDVAGAAHRRRIAEPLRHRLDALAHHGLGLGRRACRPRFIEEFGGGQRAAPEEVVGDYESLRLSLKAHPVSFLRERLVAQRIIPCAGVASARMGARVSACGVVLVRQRPGSAKGVCFITLEDETGTANLVVWPKVFEEFRPLIMSAKLLLAHGRIQRATDADGGVTHLIVERLEDRTGDLMTLSAEPVRTPRAPGDEPGRAGPSPAERHRHPRDVRLVPKSRDFH